MALSIGVPRERASGERRVALVPEVVGRLVKEGYEVWVEHGAGEMMNERDAAFVAQGARVVSREEALGASVVVKVNPPDPEEIAGMQPGGVLVGFLSPLDRPAVSRALAERGVTAFSMELVPRISRAQKMDALSAMSSIAGYRAVLLSAVELPKFFPLLTTAAGTLRPASVLVLGAGVAGLQAIATAKRLGARVFAYDIREAVKEEIQSLGGAFVELEVEVEEAQDSGGYAKALSEEKARRQTELLVPHIAAADVVISTALIPGRPAPLLITQEAVEAMKPGSVIIDLAAPNGGNCALTRADERVLHQDVVILGPTNLPGEMAVHASQMFARTIMAMIQEIATSDGLRLDFENPVIKGACVSHEGQIVNERVAVLV
jgi:H+-translocating NAD(P) transhydrogenase subunit alpha